MNGCQGGTGLVSGPQTAFRLTRAHGEVSVICNLIARRKVVCAIGLGFSVHSASIPAGVSYSITDHKGEGLGLSRCYDNKQHYSKCTAKCKPTLSPLQKSDTKKEKGKGSEDLRLVRDIPEVVYDTARGRSPRAVS